MKKIVLYIIGIVLFSSCEKVLDKQRYDKITDTDIWNDDQLAKLYLNNLYSFTLPEFSGTANTTLSTEAIGSGTGYMMYGGLVIGSSSAPYPKTLISVYTNIRKINVLLTSIDDGSIATSTRHSIKGQAFFLRAWTYWNNLVLYHGGMPLILYPQDPVAEANNLKIARNTTKECINAITNDLDSAISYCPATWSGDDYGRITRGAAAALKGRVLLFYASPQFNPNNDLVRWDSAYQANKTALAICKADGYGLYSDFANIFINGSKTEGIFVRLYSLAASTTHSYENNVRPISESYNGGQTNNPSLELVNAFPMKNGKAITDASSGYDTAYFWKNRDPRFAATIAWNGCVWPLSKQADRKQWTYTTNSEEKAKPTKTGFYCRKNIDASILKADILTGTPTNWLEIRYAEVMLNLAECAAELGSLDEAKEQVYAIRKRAGIEAGDGTYGISASTKTEMVASIILEREIEFAYENKSHWDLRRRNLYISDLGSFKKLNETRRHGLIIALDTSYIRKNFCPTITDVNKVVAFFEANMRDTIDLDKNYFKYFSHSKWEGESTDINYLQPLYNFYYIDPTEILFNTKLKQTIGWATSDYFDPYAE